MGASPDGLIIDPSKQQPHSDKVFSSCRKKLSLFDLCMKKEYKLTFYLWYTNNKYELKKQNTCYYQIQGQLHITCRSWCDFVVWTPSVIRNDLFIEQIYYGDFFWSNTIYPQLHWFYMGSMLPQLASPRHVSGQEVRELGPFRNDNDLCSSY